MSKAKKHTRDFGSKIARNGFINEDIVISKFNGWQNNPEAKECLEIMGYQLDEIEKVEAVKIGGNFKTDVQVQIAIYLKKAIDEQNISVKLVSNPTGFNQIDKRWIEKYRELWDIPENITNTLKLYTGEISPTDKSTRDPRRMFLDEIDSQAVSELIDFVSQNKILIVSDILKGRGKFSVDWILVVFSSGNITKWCLKSINEAMNIFGRDEVVITKQGNLKIGRITCQRKGGDGGRETAKMLQFKMNPMELFLPTSLD